MTDFVLSCAILSFSLIAKATFLQPMRNVNGILRLNCFNVSGKFTVGQLSTSCSRRGIFPDPGEWGRKWAKWLDIDQYRHNRRKLANLIANRYKPERVAQMGPDFACLEWFMNAGATSVLMSDGTLIKSRQEMRDFLKTHGFDVWKLEKTEAPESILMKDFESKRQFESSINSDLLYDMRWKHISSIHMKEINASDSVITDNGIKYIMECRNIEKIQLNFCDYFGDDGIAVLAQGRTVRTLKELEICFCPMVTDFSAFMLCKFRALQRLHMYFLPYVSKRPAMLRQLRLSLPRCKVTFPEEYFIGMGYETEEEKATYIQANKHRYGRFSRFFE